MVGSVANAYQDFPANAAENSASKIIKSPRPTPGNVFFGAYFSCRIIFFQLPL